MIEPGIKLETSAVALPAGMPLTALHGAADEFRDIPDESAHPPRLCERMRQVSIFSAYSPAGDARS